jgi:hypothetical protein
MGKCGFGAAPDEQKAAAARGAFADWVASAAAAARREDLSLGFNGSAAASASGASLAAGLWGPASSASTAAMR